MSERELRSPLARRLLEEAAPTVEEGDGDALVAMILASERGYREGEAEAARRLTGTEPRAMVGDADGDDDDEQALYEGFTAMMPSERTRDPVERGDEDATYEAFARASGMHDPRSLRRSAT